MVIINKTKDTVLATKVIVADNFFSRAKGLLGRSGFPEGEAMVLKPCNSIHTFFMRFPIDVIFVDKENKIISLNSCVKPWRVTTICWRAKFTIELPCGVILKTLTACGDEITLE